MTFPFSASDRLDLTRGQAHGLTAAQIEAALVHRLLERSRRSVRRETPFVRFSAPVLDVMPWVTRYSVELARPITFVTSGEFLVRETRRGLAITYRADVTACVLLAWLASLAGFVIAVSQEQGVATWATGSELFGAAVLVGALATLFVFLVARTETAGFLREVFRDAWRYQLPRSHGTAGLRPFDAS